MEESQKCTTHFTCFIPLSSQNVSTFQGNLYELTMPISRCALGYYICVAFQIIMENKKASVSCNQTNVIERENHVFYQLSSYRQIDNQTYLKLALFKNHQGEQQSM